MSNTLPIDFLDSPNPNGKYNGFHDDPKDNFHLVIDYPSHLRCPEFQAQVELLDKVGGSMGLLIATYLTMDIGQRNDETQLEYLIVEEITGFAQSLADSIETTWSVELNDFVPNDPDDNYAYHHATESIFGGYDNPLTAWNMARKLIPLFNFYYSHISIPEEMDIYEDWDYDINVFGECAIIQFKSAKNKEIFSSLII